MDRNTTTTSIPITFTTTYYSYYSDITPIYVVDVVFVHMTKREMGLLKRDFTSFIVKKMKENEIIEKAKYENKEQKTKSTKMEQEVKQEVKMEQVLLSLA